MIQAWATRKNPLEKKAKRFFNDATHKMGNFMFELCQADLEGPLRINCLEKTLIDIKNGGKYFLVYF